MPAKLEAFDCGPGKPRIWKCHSCKRPFQWGPESRWYGSLRDEDEKPLDQLPAFCSGECARKYGKAVPA